MTPPTTVEVLPPPVIATPPPAATLPPDVVSSPPVAIPPSGVVGSSGFASGSDVISELPEGGQGDGGGWSIVGGGGCKCTMAANADPNFFASVILTLLILVPTGFVRLRTMKK